jgi:hypothetical protein
MPPMNPQPLYEISRDLALLARLVRRQSVVCFVDYPIAADMAGAPCRDVCKSRYRKEGDTEHFSLSSRGLGYVDAVTEEEFVSQCAGLNCEFIVPPGVHGPEAGAIPFKQYQAETAARLLALARYEAGVERGRRWPRLRRYFDALALCGPFQRYTPEEADLLIGFIHDRRGSPPAADHYEI